MVLVTGANSLLGVNTVAALMHQGYKVKAFVRNPAVFPLAMHPNLHLVKGDINNPQSIEIAVVGCEIIIHIAAITDQHLTSYKPYYTTNVLGTKALLEIAVRNKATHFIYVSSANTIGYGTLSHLGNEKTPARTPFTKSYYAKSKIEAQDYVLKTAKENTGTKIVVVNPTFMLGKYDTKPSSGKIILMASNKRMVLIPPGGKNFIHVSDAAQGIVNAITLGKHGEKYLLAGENISYKQFYQKLNKITGTNQLYITIPKYILYAVGITGSVLRLVGIKTAASLTNMRIVCVNNYYSNTKAKQNLNLQTKAIDDAIVDALQWFKTKNNNF